jgi:F-type H+-transporting ATPase subunit epsilon
MMAKLFNLKILTPEKQFFDSDVESLIVTTTDGRFEFLADHVPVIMPLAVGTLSVRTSNGTTSVFNSEGFLEVRKEGVLVYVQACESPAEIDRRRAEEAKMRAEERLRQKQSMHEYQQSKLALARAMARLSLTKMDSGGDNTRPPM